MLRNEKGFTLIEIIAVLVILGILAAVAIPRYIDMMTQSRVSAAQTAMAEIKARASGYYATQMLQGNGVTTPAAVLASVNSNNGVGSDFTLTTGASGSDITINVTQVKGADVTVPVGTWFYPVL